MLCILTLVKSNLYFFFKRIHRFLAHLGPNPAGRQECLEVLCTVCLGDVNSPMSATWEAWSF